MSSVAEKLLTEEEYLKLEDSSIERREFLDGVLRAMAGITEEHNEIVLNIATKLLAIARSKGCRLRAENVKLRLPFGSKRQYYYPDIVVACGPKSEDSHMLENPCFIIEVLSDSTASIDKGEKLETYQHLPSIKQYVLVDQSRRKIEIYSRHDSVWIYKMLESGSFNVACLDTEINLDEIYAGLTFNVSAENTNSE
jgi:Uma2 family endonuclease